MTRRTFLSWFGTTVAGVIGSVDSAYRLSRDDERFLDELERAAFRYFVEQTNPQNGLVRDRDRIDAPASIAATGFGLVAWAIAAQRRWVSTDDALKIALTTLRFFAQEAQHVHGFFYHFLDFSSGERYQEKWKSEISSVDTAWLLAGVLVVKEVFPNHLRLQKYAEQIEERIDWRWMCNGQLTLTMGWTPEQGFLPSRWDKYAEHMLMYLLALGSPTYPLPSESWDAWERNWTEYKGYRYLDCPPLFTHQYSHAFVDFRKWRDRYADYWESSVQATLANRQFCIDHADRFKSYGPNSWGLTACDGPDGYRAYGAKEGWHDGTVAPCAAAGSLPFAPRECLAALRFFREQFSDRLWGKYGFRDAFNLDRNWWATDTLGIDQGITLLMIENLRTGLVWRWMARNSTLQKGLKKAGFFSRTPR
ncbi:MAG: hypothetical protein N3B10_12210 [Armatimonadetes bacterium]|nr:hypothetical protein [Armatimonadota bacterium]